jgi:predicted RNA polymerase sigma factor
MAGLVETGGSGRAVGSVARLRVDQGVRAVEREYREHRDSVLAMLAAQFPRLGDPEELYQDAWAELLELEQQGRACPSSPRAAEDDRVAARRRHG